MNIARTFFVKIEVNLDDTPDLSIIANEIFEDLTDSGYSVLAVDIRDDAQGSPTPTATIPI